MIVSGNHRQHVTQSRGGSTSSTNMHAGDDDVADDDDGEIRRRVVGAVMVQLLAARGQGSATFR